MDEEKVQFISKYDGYRIRGFDRFQNGVLKVSQEEAEELRKTPGFGTEFWEDKTAPEAKQVGKQGVVTLADINKREDGTYELEKVTNANLEALAKSLGVEVKGNMTKPELIALITPGLPQDGQ